MKILINILLFLFLPFLSVAQEQAPNESFKKETNTFKNNITLGFEILAPSVSYTRKITNNISIGTGVGLGLSIAFGESQDLGVKDPGTKFQDGIVEGAHIGVIIEFKLNRYLYYELKLQSIALFDRFGDSFSAVGLKNGLFIQLKKIKLGLNVTIGKTESDKWLFYIQPLKIKIPLQW